MAHPPETQAAVRRAYVAERRTLGDAAAAGGVPEGTARAWKRAARESGDDWDRARAAARMAAGGLGDLTTQVLEDAAELSQRLMEDLRTGDLTPLQKAEALSRLADSYAKIVKASGAVDPRLARLSVAMEVLERLAVFVRQTYPQHAAALLEVLEPFGREIGGVYG